MDGFPPAEQERWTFDNWQYAPVNRWAFQHVREIVPTARVARDESRARELRTGEPFDLTLPISRADGTASTVEALLAETHTDGFLVLSGGRVVAEQYFGSMADDTTHLLFSVSKSIVSAVCGILTDRGLIDLDSPVSAYIPEVVGAGYDGATVRHLLDMRSGIAFSEEYLDPTAEVRQLEQVIGWAPRTIPDLPTSMYEWLATLHAKGPHGGPFEYRSCETDMLGWVCERASGTRMPELLSELLWAPLHTEHDMDAGVDAAGAVLHDGGLAATLRDLARFGQLIADRGAVGHARVVPAWWFDDAATGGADSREAFAASASDTRLPGGMYRNQFWVPFADEDVLLCLGIHGQLVYVDRRRNVVGVKLSSWPYPQDAAMFVDTIAMMRAVAAAVGNDPALLP